MNNPSRPYTFYQTFKYYQVYHLLAFVIAETEEEAKELVSKKANCDIKDTEWGESGRKNSDKKNRTICVR